MEDGTSTSLGHTEGTTTGAVSASIAALASGSGGCGVEATTTCEIRDLLDRLADKWSLLVVELLGDGSRRFTELKREIEGISQRMLTRTLRQLERDGLVTRTVHPVVPPRVDYELTPLGATLLDAIEPLVAWTRAHRDAIATSRAAYDHTVAASATGGG
jgi:DNA-binding HxlR family transcriptional regulator